MSLTDLIIPPQVKLAFKLAPWALLALALAWGAWERSEASHYHKLADSCSAGRTADRAAYVAAQATATLLATAAKHAEETRTAIIKEKSDHELDTAKGDAARQLAQFIRTHRVPNAAAQGNPGGTDLPGDAIAAEVDHGTSGSAVVAASDLAICTDNTARLLNAHAWAVTLEGAK
jgi:hypothetical protein